MYIIFSLSNYSDWRLINTNNINGLDRRLSVKRVKTAAQA